MEMDCKLWSNSGKFDEKEPIFFTIIMEHSPLTELIIVLLFDL